MDLTLKNCPVFHNMDCHFRNGIHFYLTTDKTIQKKIQRCFKDKKQKDTIIILDNHEVSARVFKKYAYFVNCKEKTFLHRHRKLKSMIHPDSKIAEALDVHSEVFDLRFQQLWHWSYVCSCAIGLEKGKTILFFPWIPAKECCVQSYRIKKLYEYAQSNDLIVIIPTDSLDNFRTIISEDVKYSVYK